MLMRLNILGNNVNTSKVRKDFLQKTDKILIHSCRIKRVFCSVCVSESMIEVMGKSRSFRF
jgi:hypothetical protein